jgi:hypothetical protein
MDLSTLSLGLIWFGTTQAIPLAGLASYRASIDLRPANNLVVDIDASLNANTGLLTWKFVALDPATRQPPLNPTVGFLPPNLLSPEGEGGVLMTIMPKRGLPTGEVIVNR